MPNCCGSSRGCECLIQVTPGLVVSGAGTPSAPYVISIDNGYLSALGSGVSHDTDGRPYYDPEDPEYVVFYDTDDVPYYETGTGGVPLLQDVDAVPYLTLGA